MDCIYAKRESNVDSFARVPLPPVSPIVVGNQKLKSREERVESEDNGKGGLGLVAVAKRSGGG